MEAIVEVLEEILHGFTQIAMAIFELIGAGVIVYAVVKGFIDYLRKKPGMKLDLAENFSVGLKLLMGSEILKTIVVREMSSVYFVGGIIVLRVALTLLLHWEMKLKKEEEKEAEEGPHGHGHS